MSGSFHSRIRDTKKAFVPLCARRLIPATTSVRMLPFNPIPWLYVGNPKNRAGIKVGETPLARSGRNPRLVANILANSFLKGDIRLRAMRWNDSHPHPPRNPLNLVGNSAQPRKRTEPLNDTLDFFSQLRSRQIAIIPTYLRGINFKNDTTDFLTGIFHVEITYWREFPACLLK